MPVFSGVSVDPLVNKLDTKRIDLAIEKRKYDPVKREIHGIFDAKASALANTRSSRPGSRNTGGSSASSRFKNYLKITETDKNVIEKYLRLKSLIDAKKMTKIFIEAKECIGIIPEAREKASISTHNNKLYVFGGTGSQRFNYFNIFDFHKQRWEKKFPKNSVKTDLPSERFGHSICSFENLFILFGGCGSYSEKTKMHESFRDVRVFDIDQFVWEKIDYYSHKLYKQFEPEKRMFHAAAIFGPMMMVNGGLKEEDSQVSNDIYIFDIHHRRWIGCTVMNSEDKESCLESRYMHSMTPVINPRIDSKIASSMALMTQNFKTKLLGDPICFEKMGLYIFGGLDENHKPTNDLFHIRICHRETGEIYDNFKLSLLQKSKTKS